MNLFRDRHLVLSWFVVRVIAAVMVTPVLAERLFLPHFLEQSNPFDFSIDGEHSDVGESPFPYGLPMYFVYLPVYLAVKISNSADFNLLTGFAVFAITIVADYAIFKILRTREFEPRVLLLWCLSPIVLWSAYLIGESDLWPALFFLISCRYLVDKESAGKAGVFLGIAIGCKYGLILVIPFALVYLLDNPRYKNQFKLYLASSISTAAICYLPAAFSEGFRDLVFKSELASKTLEIGLDFGSFKFYFVPALYLVLLVWIYRAGRTTPQVFTIFLSVAVISTVLFTPAAFGWILWVLPTLLIYLDVKKSDLVWVFALFQLIYLISKSSISEKFGLGNLEWFNSISQTLLTVYSLLFLMRILQHGVTQGDIYSLAKKPFSVSISGDSGVGKDSLTGTLQEAFGIETTTVICGDNYHLFERGDFVWGSKTHLNPQMNDISQWKKDLSFAKNRETFITREYDHTKGRFTTARSSKRADLVISQGLHANYGELCRSSDASIHLEMDDELRVHLKLARDVNSRNRSKEDVIRQLEARKEDFEKFINVQRGESDLTIRFLQGDELEVRFIEISSLGHSKIISDIYNEILTHCPDALIQIDGEKKSVIRIDCGQISPAFTEVSLKNLLIGFRQFFPTLPTFKGGVQGVLQLVVFRTIEFNRLKEKGSFHEPN